jgi:hypothetical protein
VDSIFKAKKYELPLLAFHPIVGGGVAVDYLVSSRFNPAKDAKVLDPTRRTLQLPLTADERRLYEKGLQELLEAEPELPATPGNPTWKQFQERAELDADSAGRPILRAEFGDSPYRVGISRDNILTATTTTELARQLLVARLRDELKKNSARKVSDAGIRQDWNLLQSVISAQRAEVATRTAVPGSGARAGTD